MKVKSTNLERTAIIKGDLKFTNYGQIIRSNLFKKLITQIASASWTPTVEWAWGY